MMLGVVGTLVSLPAFSTSVSLSVASQWTHAYTAVSIADPVKFPLACAVNSLHHIAGTR